MIRQALDGVAERATFSALARLPQGQLELHLPDGVRSFGPGGSPSATMAIRDRRFFRRLVFDGEVGLGESYMDGDWTTPDLVGLVRLMIVNREALSAVPGLASVWSRLRDTVAHRIRDNSRGGSRRNIHAHYDLGNAFFSLFLDPRLMYSCAVYGHNDESLEDAQRRKLALICDKLALTPDDHVLEIGTGWGGFAHFAATHYGCRVTTTTISEEQHAFAQALLAQSPHIAGRVELLKQDYRDLQGQFDKVVSIEMFEAVGLRHYDDFFGACDRLLRPDGVMLLQTITVDDWRFRDYLSTPSWIAKYIFPGAELASVGEMLASLSRVSRLALHHAEQIGTHYARTLHQWRDRFHDRIDIVRAQGFDERFIRMWDLYLAFCEGAFLERHIGDVQLILAKAGTPRVLYGEPWAEGTQAERGRPALASR